MHRRLSAVVGAVAALLTAMAVAVTLVAGRQGDRLDTVVIAVALLWGAAGQVALFLTRDRRGDRRAGPAEPPGPVAGVGVGFTTVVRLGEEPDDIVRTTVAVAAEGGPVVLVTAGREPPPGLPDDVVVARGQDPGTAMGAAIDQVATDVVLVVSARALPVAPTCRAGAARLSGTAPAASWLVGGSEPLNTDRYGPARRDAVDARLRRRAARAGLWLWETDATLVRTDLLRGDPPGSGRPLGAWLRDRARDDARGEVVDDTLSRRAAPVAESRYWPDTVARQRGAAADLSDAVWRRGGIRSRLVAAALLLRVLSGWSVVLWLLALVLVADGMPVSVRPGAYVVLVAAAVAAQWIALRVGLGLRPRPGGDALGAFYAVPGSLAATGAAITRRVRPARVALPSRPLVWVGLVATVVAANGLLSADPAGGTGRVAAVMSVVLLVLLWVFTVRSLAERDWDRTGFRVRLDLPAAVIGSDRDRVEGRVVDGSPGGFALEVASTEHVRGDEIEVRVSLSDGRSVDLAGTVASRRRRQRRTLLGVDLRTTGGHRDGWAAELVRAAGESRPLDRPVVVEDVAGPTSRVLGVLDRIVLGVVVATSLLVVAALVLVLLGFRPLVVRSGSMEPTYSVGDVVLVTTTTAGSLEPGDVVTRFDSPEALDSLTHRVRTVERDGGSVTVETRGDANGSSEVWTVPADTEVGRVVAHVPYVGKPATLVRTSAAWLAVAVVLVALTVAALFLRPWVARRNRSDAPTRSPERSSP